jgi:hypothetical protein
MPRKKKKGPAKRKIVHGKKGNKMFGKANGRYKDGSSKTFRRGVTKAKKGEVVHHKDHNKKNNKPGNFQKVSPAGHNKKHPEKGGNHRKKRK